MARGSGTYGNMPPGMGSRGMKGPVNHSGLRHENPAANLAQMMPKGTPNAPMGTRPSSPIGPGRPKSKPAPDGTKARVTSPTGPGTPKSKGSPDSTMSGVSTPIGPGVPKNKSQPMYRGVPGREGSTTAKKPRSTGMNGQKGSGRMNAAGMVPPANAMGPGMVKGAKGVRY